MSRQGCPCKYLGVLIQRFLSFMVPILLVFLVLILLIPGTPQCKLCVWKVLIQRFASCFTYTSVSDWNSEFLSLCYIIIIRAGQVRELVRKSANPQLRTNEKTCGHADLRTLAV